MDSEVAAVGRENCRMKEELLSNEETLKKLLAYIGGFRSRMTQLKYKERQVREMGKSLARKEMEVGILLSYNEKRKNNLTNKIRDYELKSEELKMREMKIEAYEELSTADLEDLSSTYSLDSQN